MRYLSAFFAFFLLNSPAWSDHLDLLTGRVLHVPFDGAIDDQSGNMHTVSVVGAVGYSAGVLGMAADFDGTQSVTFPSVGDAYLADSLFTLAFWFRIDQAPVMQRYSLISQRDVCNFDDFLDIRPDSSEINFAMGQSGQAFRVAAPYALGAWHHYTAVHDGQDLRLYLDGDLADVLATGSTTFSIANPLGISVSPCIGVDGTEPYVGSLDELLLYDLPLSAEQVRALAAGHIFTDGFETAN